MPDTPVHIEKGGRTWLLMVKDLDDEPGSTVTCGDLLLYRDINGAVAEYRLVRTLDPSDLGSP